MHTLNYFWSTYSIFFHSMSSNKLNILFLMSVFTVFISCRNSTPFSGNKPGAIGKPNHVDVIMDKSLAESGVWDSLDYYFASSFPVMTAPEPFFDLRLLTMEDLEMDPYKKELKTMIFVADMSDTSSWTTLMVKKDLGEEKWKKAQQDSEFSMSITKDKWAKDQLLIYLFAHGKERLAANMKKYFPVAAARINHHDKPALEASLYGGKGKNIELSDLVKTRFNMEISIPPYFVKALEEENFLWLRMDDKKSVQNFVFRKFDYTDEAQFSKENLIALRDEYGKEFIKTSSDDAYMRTNPIDLPVYQYEYTSNDIYGKEFRGIWETVNDFMGGPFFSYLLLNKAKNEVVFIDVFVLAPGEDKRDMMQKLDYVVKNVRF